MAAKKPETTEGGEAPVKRGRGRPKGSTKSKGRGRPKGGVAKAKDAKAPKAAEEAKKE